MADTLHSIRIWTRHANRKQNSRFNGWKHKIRMYIHISTKSWMVSLLWFGGFRMFIQIICAIVIERSIASIIFVCVYLNLACSYISYHFHYFYFFFLKPERSTHSVQEPSYKLLFILCMADSHGIFIFTPRSIRNISLLSFVIGWIAILGALFALREKENFSSTIMAYFYVEFFVMI